MEVIVDLRLHPSGRRWVMPCTGTRSFLFRFGTEFVAGDLHHRSIGMIDFRPGTEYGGATLNLWHIEAVGLVVVPGSTFIVWYGGEIGDVVVTAVTPPPTLRARLANPFSDIYTSGGPSVAPPALMDQDRLLVQQLFDIVDDLDGAGLGDVLTASPLLVNSLGSENMPLAFAVVDCIVDNATQGATAPDHRCFEVVMSFEPELSIRWQGMSLLAFCRSREYAYGEAHLASPDTGT